MNSNKRSTRDVHNGDAVLIFVTEDFLADKHVKRERGDGPSVSVLKLNATSKFTTGLYPYSIMTSVFTPVAPDQKHSLKSRAQHKSGAGTPSFNSTVGDSGYHATVRSYFQSEGDRDLTLPNAILEDEIWTRIRLAPRSVAYRRNPDHSRNAVSAFGTRLAQSSDRPCRTRHWRHHARLYPRVHIH